MADRRFNDRTVVITGASAGIGLAAARLFAEEGANLVLVARGAVELEKARAAMSRLGPAIAVKFDVGDPSAPRAIIDAALEAFGAIHVLVNNAGYHTRGPVEAQDPDKLGAMVDINLKAPIVLTRHALPLLRAAAATGAGAAIVNVASVAGMVPTAGGATYSATKFGLRAFTMALADELRGTGVTASCVSPGPVETQFIMGELDTVSDLTMSQPMVTPEQVARLILACALDGKPERIAPRIAGALATLGYVAPAIRRLLRPLMEARGRAAKQKLRDRGR